MLQLYQRIVLQCLQTAVACNAAAMVVNLHQVFGNADINLFTNQIIGHAVFVFAIDMGGLCNLSLNCVLMYGVRLLSYAERRSEHCADMVRDRAL